MILHGSRSDYLTIPAGVPQGSVLGPLLFLIYRCDIVEDIESVMKLFADDTSMYLCLENPHIRAEILNNDLEKIMQWANKWKIEFNERKTELMNITRNKNHQDRTDEHNQEQKPPDRTDEHNQEQKTTNFNHCILEGLF